jgi:hypothetical protein
MKNVLVTLFALLSLSAFAVDNVASDNNTKPATPSSKVAVHKAKKKSKKSQKTAKSAPVAPAQPATPVGQ